MKKSGFGMKSPGRTWALVVLLATFGIQFIIGILTYGYGFIHITLVEEFKESESTTSIIGSLFINLMSIIGPVASYFIHKLGCRVTSSCGGIFVVLGLIGSYFANSFWLLLATNGIIAGVGIGLALIPCPVSVGYAFPKNSGIAMGIMTSGVGLGMLASGPIMQNLLENYGLRGTYLLSAAISSHIIPCAMLLRTTYKKDLTSSKSDEEVVYFKTYLTLLRTPAYMCVLIGSVLWNIAYAVIMIHLPNYVVHAGSSRTDASFLFTVIGIGTVLSRLTIGLAIGPNGIDPLLLNFGLTACMGILIVTFPFYVNFSSGPMIFASLYGVYSGGLLVFTVPLCLEFVGVNQLNPAIGLWFLLLGVGSLTGPPLAGLVFDITGSFGYSYLISGLPSSFFLAGISVLLAAFLSLVSTFWRKPANTTSTKFSQHSEFKLVEKSSSSLQV